MPRGHDTVEHIHTSGYALHEILGCAYTHQVPWLLLRELRLQGLDHVVHHGLRLPDSKSPNRISREIYFDEPLCAFLSQVRIDTALDDSKQFLPRSPKLKKTPFAANRPIH